MSSLNSEPIVASEGERSDLAKLGHLLNLPNHDRQNQKLQIIDPETGDRIQLPDSILNLLRQGVHQFDRGKGVVIETFHQPLTINEATYLLDFSRQHLVQLLKTGEIPSTGEGINRRIQFQDLIAYKKRWDDLRHQAIVEIARMSHDAGLYAMTSQITKKTTKMPAE